MGERWLTACHEAGHAVACLMRGGGTFTSVTIERTDDYLGCTFTRLKQWDSQFVSYAGPWAEARAQWPSDLSVGELDDDGGEFNDYIVFALAANPPDLQGYREPTGEIAIAIRKALERDCGDETIRQMDVARDEIWDRQLEDMWPVMLSVAQMLIDGQAVNDEVVRSLIDERLRVLLEE